jgi:hypothetical protein
MKLYSVIIGAIVLALCSASANANVFQDYEGLEEGSYGTSWDYQGVFYHDVNNVSGVFPDGETFEVPEEFRRNLIIENAGLFYNDFPGFGSPVNTLTFGMSWIPGENLTIGPLASVWMDLDEPGQAASLDLGYYENGPWGGIVYHLDGLLNGNVVASDSFVISDLGGRDNPTYDSLSIDGAVFDQLHLYATYGAEYSKPRGLVDNLSITAVPEPASLVMLASFGLLALRRRR